MNTRRSFMRWLPAVPLLGPLAVKAGAAVQSVGRIPAQVPVMTAARPQWVDFPNTLRGVDPTIILVDYGTTGHHLPIIRAGQNYLVNIGEGQVFAPTLHQLLGLVRQAHGLAH